MIRIALIADPHVHDCAWRPEGAGLAGAVRSFAETAVSTRVFNESLPAFRAALERTVAEGAGLALLVGDLTDDGQAPNIAAALRLIAEFRDRHGLRVLATPGNHDLFALHGRPQDKSFLHYGGPCLVRSADSPDAATLGTAEALTLMEGLGYRPEATDLHWETPFGQNPDWEARHYDVPSPDGRTLCRMIDASYLVEPVAGLWVLSLDSNVCPPRDGATDFTDPGSFHDPTNGGWPAVLRHRGHLLPWMRDVAGRAAQAGKALIAFSHYPVLDALGGSGADEVALFGVQGLARRTPSPEVAEAFAATGVRLHVSGHLHVNDTARHGDGARGFFNVAMPSPVGFCPAMKLAEVEGLRVRLRTLPLTQVAGHDAAFAAYQTEAARAGRVAPLASHAPDHGVFLDRHLQELVHGRYIPREWPRDMAEFVQAGRVDDLLTILGLSLPGAPDLPLRVLAEDWYRLRKGGELSHGFIGPERLAFYRALFPLLPPLTGQSLSARFVALLRILQAYMERLPNADFTLDLADLTITA